MGICAGGAILFPIHQRTISASNKPKIRNKPKNNGRSKRAAASAQGAHAAR